MTFYRKLLAGAFAFCLVSGSGVALVAAQAETAPAIAAAAATPVAKTPLFPAPVVSAGKPAAPAAVTAPSPAAAASPADDAEPAERTAGVSEAEMTCLTRVILYEAGAESRAGQLAVAQVVLNRMRSGRFPRTICGVINQRGQFSAIRSFQPARNARWERAEGIAQAALDGERAPGVGSALYFHAAHASAFRGRTRVARLGNHIFYR
jgi:spore germination cell wall hydrolase CwlJ-like protein